MADDKALRLRTEFAGGSPRFEGYRPFLRNVVMDGSPAYVAENDSKPGRLQEVLYRVLQPTIRLLSHDTKLSFGTSECVDIIFRGGAGVRDRTDVHCTIVQRKKYSEPLVQSHLLGSPYLAEAEGDPKYNLWWKADKPEYMDLRDAVQHGFSDTEAERLMLHFRRRMMWLRAMLIPCDMARFTLLVYFQNALSAELLDEHQSHDPKEWEAYCHVSLCKNPECTSFAKPWDKVMLQTRVAKWMKLYERHEKLFRAAGIQPK